MSSGLWSVESHPKSGGFTHGVPAGLGHGWFVPIACSHFDRLRVGVSITNGTYWWALRQQADVIPFEMAHAVEVQRWTYNRRMFELARARNRPVRGEHAGLCDYFAPVMVRKEAVAFLVVGPFASEPPNSATVLERWRILTGTQGQATSPEFSAYLQVSLSMLVLDRHGESKLARFLSLISRLMASAGPADASLNEIDALGIELGQARFPELMWDTAHSLIEEASQKSLHSAARAYELEQVGLARAPDQVVAGLFVSRRSVLDPVEEQIQRNAFQRACTHLARTEGEVVSGRIGDYGVTFLVGSKGSATQRRRKLVRIVERAAVLAKRFDFKLHAGASASGASAGLLGSYEEALGAAEFALTRGSAFEFLEPRAFRPEATLRTTQDQLVRVAIEHTARLPAEFERFLEAVAIKRGQRIDAARADLTIAFERVAAAVLESGAIDAKSHETMRERLDRAQTDARSVQAIFATYRAAIFELARAVANPAQARHARGLEAALEYIHRHLGKALPLDKVAKVAGFSSDHFSELFKKEQRVTFERYLMRLRLDRARELLTGTDLSVTRIAELSGHGSAQYFCRLFRRAEGSTPLEYRRKRLPHWAKRGATTNPVKYKVERRRSR